MVQNAMAQDISQVQAGNVMALTDQPFFQDSEEVVKNVSDGIGKEDVVPSLYVDATLVSNP